MPTQALSFPLHWFLSCTNSQSSTSNAGWGHGISTAAPPHGQASHLSEVRRIVRGVLGDDGVTDDQPLVEAGLDSLAAISLRDDLATAFGLSLPATLVFDRPSISALSEFISVHGRRQALPEAATIESIQTTVCLPPPA
jgi:acyl carrier protein